MTSDGIRLVTDSTAGIEALSPTAEWRVVPLELEIDGRRYREGPELTAAGFHRLLQEVNTPPVTLPPPVEKFVEVFGELLAPGGRVLSIHLSGELSRTAEHAREAVRRLSAEDRVEVLDSRLAGPALGLVCLEAERRLAGGESLAATVSGLGEAAAAMRLYFSVYTLDYLYLGGRLRPEPRGDAPAAEDRPILTMREGALELVERVKGETTRVERMAELIGEQFGATEPLVAACVHAGSRGREAAARLEGLLADGGRMRWHRVPLSPVLCAHTGFDVCGVAVLPDER